jgi:hypothetical protein
MQKLLVTITAVLALGIAQQVTAVPVHFGTNVVYSECTDPPDSKCYQGPWGKICGPSGCVINPWDGSDLTLDLPPGLYIKTWDFAEQFPHDAYPAAASHFTVNADGSVCPEVHTKTVQRYTLPQVIVLTTIGNVECTSAGGGAGEPGEQGPQGKVGPAGSDGGQGAQGKVGPQGDPAPCVDCQDVANAAFDLACKLVTNNPATSIGEFTDCVDAAVSIAIVNANVCGGTQACQDDIAGQIQAIFDAK